MKMLYICLSLRLLHFKGVSDINHYKQVHYIPDVDLDFSNFEGFYEKRKELLKSKFAKIMNA